MSDAGSTTSKQKNYRDKVCAYCGKIETDQLPRHSKNQHPGLEKKEWVPGEPLLGEPYCKNWKEIIEDKNVKPIGLLPQFQKGSYSANAKKASRSAVGKTPAFSAINGDVQMQNIEEEKSGGAVQFGALEQTTQKQQSKAPSKVQSIIGKRSPIIAQGELLLEQQVQQDLHPDDSISVAPYQSKRIQNSNVVAKVENQKLSAKSLKSLPQASMEQMRQTPKDESEFIVPFPIQSTVYVTQGMRDQEAIQKLIVLNQNTTDIVQARILELIKLTPMFAQNTVSSYIERNKDQLSNIKDLLLRAHGWVEDLEADKISSIAFASVLFGGSIWASLPKMFNSLESSKLDDVLSLLDPLLSAKFNENLAKWFCTSWRYIEEQTLGLLRYLKEQHLENDLAFDIATISRMVHIVDVTKYFTTIEVFSQYSSFKTVMDTIKFSAPQWKPEQKLSFGEFCALVEILVSNGTKHLLKANEEDLRVLPLKQWVEKITSLQSASLICDVSLAQHRLIKLCEEYGPLLKSHAIDLCLSGDARYQTTLHEVSNPPNALQFANAQYAAFSLRDRPKQLWCIPSGQGKSRTLATIALILLLANSTTKVHLVFDSLHLMLRDKREFSPWFDLHGILNCVEFHVGLNFECQPGDVILIDEADELILSDPAKFMAKIQHFKCICLTATPDNEDNKGIERRVLQHMGFVFFNGQPDKQVSTSSSIACSTTTLQFSPDAQLISFIQKEMQECAVLLYCSLEFQELLIAADVPFLQMKDGENINDEFLRTLDNRTPEGAHILIVATSSFGMRGFDYRSNKGITLIIAASFEHQRQATQGLNRVGRFSDPCKRLIAKDVTLIDKEQQWKYIASLNQFLSQQQKTKVVAHLPKEEKKKQSATTTTNTAKSTPVVGKPKRGQQKQNQSSQSAITMPAKKDLTRRQTQLLIGGQVDKAPTVEKKDDAEAILFGDSKKKTEDEDDNIVITDSQIFD